MPQSHQRKGHRAKVAARNKRIKDQRRHIQKIYNQIAEQLRNRPISVPDMLNKEQEQILNPNGHDIVPEIPEVFIPFQQVVLSPEEEAEQAKIRESAVLTTNSTP